MIARHESFYGCVSARKLRGAASASHVPRAEIAACAAKPETLARVQHSVELGKSVNVTGTPTLFVNGRKIANLGIPMDKLKGIVDFDAKTPQ